MNHDLELAAANELIKHWKRAAERADKVAWAKALLVSMENIADDNPNHWASEESRRHYAALTIATLREEIGQLEGKIK